VGSGRSFPRAQQALIPSLCRDLGDPGRLKQLSFKETKEIAMTLIVGSKLTPRQREEVLRCFVHRWTHENARQTYGGQCPGCAQRSGSGTVIVDGREVAWHDYHRPLQTDDEWLREHAFHVTKAGRLDRRHDHCVPSYLAS